MFIFGALALVILMLEPGLLAPRYVRRRSNGSYGGNINNNAMGGPVIGNYYHWNPSAASDYANYNEAPDPPTRGTTNNPWEIPRQATWEPPSNEDDNADEPTPEQHFAPTSTLTSQLTSTDFVSTRTAGPGSEPVATYPTLPSTECRSGQDTSMNEDGLQCTNCWTICPNSYVTQRWCTGLLANGRLAARDQQRYWPFIDIFKMMRQAMMQNLEFDF